jgi:hypothetical protein
MQRKTFLYNYIPPIRKSSLANWMRTSIKTYELQSLGIVLGDAFVQESNPIR